MTYAKIEALAEVNSLLILGGFHPETKEHLPDWCETLLLFGPAPRFWTAFSTSPEWRGQEPDPMDRWSTRVLGDMAAQLNGKAFFPFGGAPFLPFFSWALKSGQAWQSPVNLLVHSEAGLMVSYRGALALRGRLDLPPAPAKPCDTCDKPCLTACVPRALTADCYDVPACKAHLASENGKENMELGCSVRRACPVSQSYARMTEQNAFHMRSFMGENR